jgi:hypothetical protein
MLISVAARRPFQSNSRNLPNMHKHAANKVRRERLNDYFLYSCGRVLGSWQISVVQIIELPNLMSAGWLVARDCMKHSLGLLIPHKHTRSPVILVIREVVSCDILQP